MILLLLTVAFAQDTVALPSEMTFAAVPDVTVSPLLAEDETKEEFAGVMLADVQVGRIEQEVAALEIEVEKQADNNMAICKALNIECEEVEPEAARDSGAVAEVEDSVLVTVQP